MRFPVAERAAATRGDRVASVRLSSALHVHLVEALGNAELSHFLADLLSRSSVMVSVYESAPTSSWRKPGPITPGSSFANTGSYVFFAGTHTTCR
ncbi:hypothetical protein [Bradyrhizobium canariense]|uniref:hypothetical protein n=1 Tax=Bradyrhizobium canariense TaxID=255045 RepID=UPI001FE4CD86|nr:hypothetical protein [Bradyrhizobium canariense]